MCREEKIIVIAFHMKTARRQLRRKPVRAMPWMPNRQTKMTDEYDIIHIRETTRTVRTCSANEVSDSDYNFLLGVFYSWEKIDSHRFSCLFSESIPIDLFWKKRNFIAVSLLMQTLIYWQNVV